MCFDLTIPLVEMIIKPFDNKTIMIIKPLEREVCTHLTSGTYITVLLIIVKKRELLKYVKYNNAINM